MSFEEQQTRLQSGLLLDQKGIPFQVGYSYSLLKTYDRQLIRASRWRIKQWDYYYVGDEGFGVCFTIADLSYAALISVTLIDFQKKRQITKSFMKWLTFGNINMPSSSAQGKTTVSCKEYSVKFETKDQMRIISCYVQKFDEGNDFQSHLTLKSSTPHSAVVVIPFQYPQYFYYNQKINLLKAEGYYRLGKMEYNFKSNTYGVLDWGRGVWTYNNTWFWSSMSGRYKGHLIGFNFGYGFGNNKKGSQNVFYYDNEIFKFTDIEFKIPKDENGNQSYTKGDWKIVNKQQSINITFEPILDRSANFNYLIIKSNQHQVFGYFSGFVRLLNRIYKFQKMIGFAEKVMNQW